MRRSTIDDINFAQDARVNAKRLPSWCETFDKHRMVFLPVWELMETEPPEVPAKFDVCSLCEGKGTHINPSIDAGGLSADDFAEDPDFAEDYFSGVYDVRCNGCDGERVKPAVDTERTPTEVLRAIDRWEDDEAACRAEQLAEIRMGA